MQLFLLRKSEKDSEQEQGANHIIWRANSKFQNYFKLITLAYKGCTNKK